MPRMIRLVSPGAITHVMARGIDGKNIFIDDEDREAFLSRLTILVRVCGYRCFAWCLMDNHYHLLFRTNENHPGRLMRPLNGGYARWFNKKYSRRGYLFQDRYKSVLCQDQEYAKQLIRYIHLNPLRAGKVQTLDELQRWPWCGHAFLLGAKKAAGALFQERVETLRRFGESEKRAIDEYLKYMSMGIDPDHCDSAGLLPETEYIEISGSQKGWPAVIGDPDFVKKAMASHEIGERRKHRQADYASVLAKIAGEACAKFKLDPEELWRRGRENSRSDARSYFCRRSCEEELLPMSIAARFLKISIQSVAELSRRKASIPKSLS